MKIAKMVGGLVALLCVALAIAPSARAQQRAWVQVEAQPTLAEAEGRAEDYASSLPDVVGYRLGSRWYGIALGPYDAVTAAARLRQLKAEGRIPTDSFISDGTNFREQFWPRPGEVAIAPEARVPEGQAIPDTPSAAAEALEETPAEARRSEADLTRDDRMDLQRALQWGGFYSAGIDGAFGPGTRNSMAAWQAAMGMEPTGVLTARQRDMLVSGWREEMRAFGFETVSETEAGIEITLPLGLVGFDHYEPPFVHFTERDGSGLRVILISQPGDRAALYGLYDILQTLTIIPMEGERTRGERSFEITGRNGTVASHAYAELSQGLVKGYILVWNPADEARAQRVLGLMKSSFRPVGNRALDPGMVEMDTATRSGLLAGLELRKPRLGRSGFYVDARGTVATTTEAVQGCTRVTLDGVTEADVLVADPSSGIALLRPATALAPPAVASFQSAPDRIGAEVAVAGYAYEGALPAPVLTFGRLEDVTGLNGEAGIKRLSIMTLAGDAGGPVVDATGAVLGMLLPREVAGARVLPEGVEFAATAPVITALMAQAGLAPAEAAPQGALAPEDLTRKATGMTVLVSCWD